MKPVFSLIVLGAGLTFMATDADAGCRKRVYYYSTEPAVMVPAQSEAVTASPAPDRERYSSAYNEPALTPAEPSAVFESAPIRTYQGRTSGSSILDRMERGRRSIKSMR